MTGLFKCNYSQCSKVKVNYPTKFANTEQYWTCTFSILPSTLNPRREKTKAGIEPRSSNSASNRVEVNRVMVDYWASTNWAVLKQPHLMRHFSSNSPRSDERKTTVGNNFRYVVKRRLVKRRRSDFVALSCRLDGCRKSAKNGTADIPRFESNWFYFLGPSLSYFVLSFGRETGPRTYVSRLQCFPIHSGQRVDTIFLSFWRLLTSCSS